MTLSTNLYVLDPVDVPELFRFVQGLLTKYDDRPEGERQTPEQQVSHDDESTWRGPGVRSLRNELGQGLPAILDITYRADGPLTTEEQGATCGEYCEPGGSDDGSDYHDHPTVCFADLDLDTAYGYRDSRGWGCGDLHAAMLAEIGQWLDERKIRWSWRNEFTGEVHGDDDRYPQLVELGRGGAEASDWFRGMVLPAILGHAVQEKLTACPECGGACLHPQEHGYAAVESGKI
jgi:hypothetical protein